VTLASLSLLVYGVVLAYALAREPAVASIVALLGGVGAFLLMLVLVRRATELLPWTLALLGVAYAIAIAARGSGVDEGAPLVGAGLLLCGELAAWSADERRQIRAERSVVVARGTSVIVLALAGLLAGGLVLALAVAPVGGGLAWTFLGAAAAVAVVGIAARLGRE
jgi:hypothetical protein